MASKKTLCPSGEVLWVSYVKNGTTVFIITSKPQREYYFLYEVCDDNTLKKLGKSRTPTELENKYNVFEKLKAN